MFSKRGISQVMVTVLLTIIGIASVLIFWYVVLPMITGYKSINIVAQRVDLTYQTTSSKLIVNIDLQNAGNVDVDVDKVEIIDDSGNWKGLTIETTNRHIPAGGSLALSCKGTGITVSQGKTYIVRITVKDTAGNQHQFQFEGTVKYI